MTDISSNALSKQIANLNHAIGKPLTEITRWFVLNPEVFFGEYNYGPDEFIMYNSGLTQFEFGKERHHTYVVDGEQLSLEIIDDYDIDEEFDIPYKLSEYSPVPSSFKACLGKVCQDVRIWKCKEALNGGERGEAGISYVFENGEEIFYCIYLHGELDSDFLLTRDQIDTSKVDSYYSLREAKEVIC